jgi:hypothetical protein
MNWFTIKEAKVSWAPIGTYTTKKGEVRTRFKRIGVKAEMMDGSWWFFSFTHNTWTKHWPLVQRLDMLGRPMTEGGKPVFLPERKDNYTVAKLHKEWLGRKPELVHALESAVEEATTEEEN